jgi:hypothetical protein
VSVEVKHGDIYPIDFVANADLTGCTVRLLTRMIGNDTTVALDCTLSDAAGGVVTHTLTGALAVGTYRVEVEATRSGEVFTFPSDGYEILQVAEDLG